MPLRQREEVQEMLRAMIVAVEQSGEWASDLLLLS